MRMSLERPSASGLTLELYRHELEEVSMDLGLINTICMLVIAVSVAVIAIHGPRR